MINLENIIGIEKENPATNNEIRGVEKEIDTMLPESYKELLKITNGFSTDNGLVIYGTGDIVERNITLEVNEYAKGYIAIGDDSGDIVFIMAEDDNKQEILAVGCGDMNPLNSEVIADSLSKWLYEGCKYNNSEVEVVTKYYGILLVESPKNGLRDLAKIKNVVDAKISSVELLKASKNIPFLIVSNLSYGKALNYLEKLNEFSDILKLQSLND